MSTPFTFTLPVPTVSAANAREHWGEKAKRTKKERQGAHQHAPHWPFQPLLELQLVRVGPGLLDDDNLRPALKAVRDGLADWLGFGDDSSPLLAWKYGQRREQVPFFVEVTVRVLPLTRAEPEVPRPEASAPRAPRQPKSLAELATSAYQAPRGRKDQ